MRRASLCLACVLWLAAPASPQWVSFSMSTYNIAFTAGDPDVTPVLTTGPVTVTYTVLFSGGANWRITVQTDDDLRNGTSVIAANRMTWTGSPSPTFRPGTLSTSAAQTIASGSGDQWFVSGQVVFSLPNSWSYDTGTYTAALVFTLTCP